MDTSAYDQFVPIDEQAAVSVSKDLQSAYLTFTAARAGRLLTYDELIKLLNDKKVVFGLNFAELQRLAGNFAKQYGTPILVASGVPPTNGADAKLDFNFTIARDKTPKLLPNGDVDHRALDYVQSVHRGDILAKMTKETQGTPGTNVYGLEAKPKNGRQRVMPKGKNTEILPDGLTLVASADGTVEILDGRITVESLLEIKGDVGPGTGHIVFSGDVRITGNVISGYNVTAEGSINIEGVIESSEVHAGHDIIISHGVKGLASKGSTCLVHAGGNITSKFIESATVFANGIIRTDSIVHSKVSSYDTIVVWGRSGNIIGGKVRALKEIVCDTVGSAGTVMSAKTVLESGLTDSITENYTKLKDEVAQLQTDIERYKQTIKELEHFLNPTSAQSKRLSASQRNLKDAQFQYDEKVIELSVLDRVFEKQDLGKITINKVLYPPVVMTIDKETRVFDEKVKMTAFRAVDHKITVVPI